ncbi:low temperature requirement protein A [Streptomyces lunaelactis]|nr:low temperature requirement protein A [Streptomyces lunaelactis]NUK10592.1 low temperature requirement protein A [Streptomyces lunaelactis]NUK25324.1 low temperature requirement protein A [Streptomyces lunaelactis]NUK36863.1 low temperature requirement protein A [Streptomyces lunaelactis]NUK43483.1 low temperature requirement protein A [Streptomyces lunaelactis]
MRCAGGELVATGRDHSRMIATEGGHRVTPAELFFDLVFVYAITQVTALMAADPTALRMLGATVVLALLWWCWCCFAWLGNVVRADSGAMFAVLVAVMAVVLIVSLTVPEVYDDGPGGLYAPLVFVLCYGAVRLLHLVTYWISSPGDEALHVTLRRTALLSVAPPFVLLLIGSAFTGLTQALLWLGAVVIDYVGIYVTGSSGWRVASPGHFAERHGLIVIIAMGESIVAIGVGVSGLPISWPVLAAAATGLLVVAGLWRVYFRQISEAAEHRLTVLEGDDRTRLARDAYTFLHLPLVAGIVFTALGMKTVLHQVADSSHYDLSEPLHGLVAWALTGGVGVFLLAAAAIVLRTTGQRSAVLIVGGLGCLAAGAVVVLMPALLALGLLAAAVTAMVVLHGRRAGAAASGGQRAQ